MITLKLTFHELQALGLITWNLSSVLLKSKDDCYLLCGLIIHKFHHRLTNKIFFAFKGKKSVTLTHEECLALHAFLLKFAPSEDEYYSTIRNEVFQTIDKKLL